MIPLVRQQYNQAFSHEKYMAYLQQLNNNQPAPIAFRVAETPVFCDAAFTKKMLDACESIVDVIVAPSFEAMTNASLPPGETVPNQNQQPNFIAFDFGVCKNEAGGLEPQLIEMQGFPTLFGFQVLQDETLHKVFNIPDNFTSYFNGYNRNSYLTVLKEILVGNHPTENVILLEILPHQQKTNIDFYCTEAYTGIKIVCLTELIKKDNQLYYLLNGKETPVKRIYNRIIFDDLKQQLPEIQEKGKILYENLDVEWVPHPNWFFRVSKYTLPFIKHAYVPETRFLNSLDEMPADLENFVLKPLFSFAGQGVIIDVTRQDIDKVTDKQNWILQKKVHYADVIETPDGNAKAEIRIFYFWKDGEARPFATHNLARLSKGKMIGVRYNENKTWVGGTIAFMEKPTM